MTSTALAVLGLGLVVEAFVRMFFRMRVNIRAGNAFLVKQIDNLDRIVKLAAGFPGTYFEAVAAALAAGLAAGARDEVTIAAATHAAFDKAGAVVDLKWRTAAERGQLGAVLAIGALVLQLALNERTGAVTTVFGLAVLGGIWHTFHKPDMAADLAAARTDVLPAIDRALAQRDNKVS